MNQRDEPLFLARETYRRRRAMDAARFLPFLGIFVFLIPTLWAREAGTATGIVYLFVAWAVLILLAVVISRTLRSGSTDTPGRSDAGEATSMDDVD